jgi:hypothetical protein
MMHDTERLAPSLQHEIKSDLRLFQLEDWIPHAVLVIGWAGIGCCSNAQPFS